MLQCEFAALKNVPIITRHIAKTVWQPEPVGGSHNAFKPHIWMKGEWGFVAEEGK